MKTSAPTAERRYSDKFLSLGMDPQNRGAYFEDEAKAKGCVLLEAKARDIKLYLLIDPDGEVVKGSKFFAYGGVESNAIAGKLCDLVKGETLSRVLTLSGEDVEVMLRDEPVVSAVPEARRDSFIVVDELIRAIRDEWPKAFARAEAAGFINRGGNGGPQYDPSAVEREWLALSKDEQLRRIEGALDGEIRDYLQSEGGDMIVRDIEDGRRIIVEYAGACQTCASSTGMTLNIIEDNLRAKLYDGLSVTPY